MEQGENRNQGHSGDQADRHNDQQGQRAPRGHNRRGRRPGRTEGRRRSAWKGYSPEQLAARAAAVPAIVYPEELPVSARREEIAAAIGEHQVVIVAGETGSGKTTQLPKICLELGRGVTGMIGHTQPRRIAARSVAERIASELGTPIGPGGVVGQGDVDPVARVDQGPDRLQQLAVGPVEVGRGVGDQDGAHPLTPARLPLGRWRDGPWAARRRASAS